MLSIKLISSLRHHFSLFLSSSVKPTFSSSWTIRNLLEYDWNSHIFPIKHVSSIDDLNTCLQTSYTKAYSALCSFKSLPIVGLAKPNLLKLGYGGSIWSSSQFSLLPQLPQKNESRFISGQKKLKNNNCWSTSVTWARPVGYLVRGWQAKVSS